MTTLGIIGIISLALGVIIALSFYTFEELWVILLGLTLMTAGIIMLLIDISKNEVSLPKEFPASEYSLELKVTEFQGQKDTTYVLIPKQK